MSSTFAFDIVVIVGVEQVERTQILLLVVVVVVFFFTVDGGQSHVEIATGPRRVQGGECRSLARRDGSSFGRPSKIDFGQTGQWTCPVPMAAILVIVVGKSWERVVVIGVGVVASNGR